MACRDVLFRSAYIIKIIDKVVWLGEMLAPGIGEGEDDISLKYLYPSKTVEHIQVRFFQLAFLVHFNFRVYI